MEDHISHTSEYTQSLERRNRELELENRNLQKIADCIPGGIRVFIKEDGKIRCVSANQYFATMIGIEKEKLIGESFENIE